MGAGLIDIRLMRSAFDTVPRSGTVPLVHHDRSSVRRPFWPRTASSPTATIRAALAATSVALFLLLAPGPRGAGAQTRTPARGDSLAADSLRQDSTGYRFPIAGLRLRADSLVLRRPSILGPFGAAAPYRPDPARVAAEEIRQAAARRARLVARRWAALVRDSVPRRETVVATVTVPDTVATVTPPVTTPPVTTPPVTTPPVTPPVANPPRTPPDVGPVRRAPRPTTPSSSPADVFGDFADLGINLRGRLESKYARSKNERCTTQQLTIIGSNCLGGFIPSFDFGFQVLTGGTVADRVLLNVDYDSNREFDASNNISVAYQGKSDEILQKLEFGNVSFQPPPSRFLTSGIPAGNYGMQATGQFGPMRFTSIVAQQKGNVSKDNVFTVGGRTQQTVENQIQDTDIQQRQFFFTIDPRQLPGYPNIDLLNRQQMAQLAASLPDSVRPTRVYVYRQLIGSTNQQPRGPRFSVRGARIETRQTYEVLRENVDYYIDPSGLWIALARQLNAANERLAVAYEVRVNGAPGRNVNTGGTPDIEATDAPQFANLLWEPELQPSNQDYFFREIKSVYRLGGEDLLRQSVTVKLVTGTSGDQEKPIDPSRGETYLQLFGLAQATNPTQFDVENRLWPRPNDQIDFAAGSGGPARLFRNYFIFFPSVQPFARAGLAQPIANPANDTIYRYPNEYLYSSQRPQAIYRMIARYLSEGGGEIGTINLPSIQLRPNSERVVLDGRVLQRETDYTINYEVGSITFSRPDTLFPIERQVTVRYEENPVFASAPTSIFGLATQFQLDRGQLSFTAISQHQKTSLTRPPLGFEPIGSLVAGVTGNLAWDASLLTRAVNRWLPSGSRSAIPSRITLQGEFAASKPQTNAAGQAYIESFEGDAGVPVSLSENAWYFSSVPTLGTRLASQFPVNPFTLNRTTTLAYQSNGADATGKLIGYNIRQIDPAVNLTNGAVQPPEQLLFMTLYPTRIGGIYDYEPGSDRRRFAWTIGDNSMVGVTPGGRRWRSLRTVLNPSGADLSRIEQIEFFVQVRATGDLVKRNPTLVLDFGEISENSVTFAPETLTIAAPLREGLRPDSTYRGKRLVGYNRFDSERDPFSRAFNALENDRGLPGDVADTIVVVDRSLPVPVTSTKNGQRLCSSAIGILQTLGDSRANCTVGNNRLDEEDIDQDGTLNSEQEQLKRFVVDLSNRANWTRVGGCQPFSDSTVTTSTPAPVATDSLCWVQVRLNWRSPFEELNNPNDRRMRALRVSMVSAVGAPDDDIARIGLARFRMVGAPWLKRSDRPISGVAGDSVGAFSGYVVASTVGTLDSTRTVPYTPPPGVVEAPEELQSDYQNNVIQVNESSLRLQAGVPGSQFRVFDRAEAFFRFPEGTKTFMGYRSLRLWMRGNNNGWGQNGELNGYVKIGRDEHNFYMYRTPVNSGPAQSAWDPEVRVDLTKFQALRAQLENNFLRGSGDSLSCSGVDLELVKRSGLPRNSIVRRYAICQDGYIVYSADPTVTPPNLAGVQELAVGFVRVDSVPRGASAIMANDTLELWVDDIRLSDVVDATGFAGELGVAMNAADLADFRLNISRRDPNFRQLGETPSFLTSNGVSVGTTLHLERMLPARLGIVIPFNIDYAGTGVEQLFINRTDVRADGIEGLRNPNDSRVNYSFAVRRAVPLAHGWYRALVNGLSLNGAWGKGTSQSAFQKADNGNYTFNAGININGDTREGKLPGVIDWLIGTLPRGIRESASMQAFRNQRVRWAPTTLSLTSGMARVANSTTSFTKAAASPTDTGQTVNGLTHFWQNNARIQFQPLTSINASLDARQLLDLRDYRAAIAQPDSFDRGQAASAERLKVLGSTLGLERERSLTSVFSFQPQLALWLRPSVDFNATFNLSKDPNARALLRTDDSVGAFRLPKRLGAAQSFSTGTVLDLGRLIRSLTGEKTLLYRLGRIIAPADIRWNQSLTSNYDNTAFLPGTGYQWGFGDIDSFRGIDSRLATNAGRTRRFIAGAGMNLPFAVSLTSRYEDGTTETWTRRSVEGFQALITTDIQRSEQGLRWSYRPLKIAKVVSNVQLNASYQITDQGTVIPNELGGLADQSSLHSETERLNGSVTWAFLGNLATSATYERQLRDDLRPGSLTTSDAPKYSFDLRRQFKLPKKWNARSPLRTMLSYSADEARSVVGGAPTALNGGQAEFLNSVLTNNGRRAFNFNADTDLSELMSFSLTGSQVLTFDRSYNRRVSNTVFSAILNLQFFAGQVR